MEGKKIFKPRNTVKEKQIFFYASEFCVNGEDFLAR